MLESEWQEVCVCVCVRGVGGECVWVCVRIPLNLYFTIIYIHMIVLMIFPS